MGAHMDGGKLLSIDEFCQRNDISRAFLYLMWKRGTGPRYLQVGSRRKISPTGEDEWRRQMETPQQTTAA